MSAACIDNEEHIPETTLDGMTVCCVCGETLDAMAVVQIVYDKRRPNTRTRDAFVDMARAGIPVDIVERARTIFQGTSACVAFAPRLKKAVVLACLETALAGSAAGIKIPKSFRVSKDKNEGVRIVAEYLQSHGEVRDITEEICDIATGIAQLFDLDIAEDIARLTEFAVNTPAIVNNARVKSIAASIVYYIISARSGGTSNLADFSSTIDVSKTTISRIVAKIVHVC